MKNFLITAIFTVSTGLLVVFIVAIFLLGPDKTTSVIARLLNVNQRTAVITNSIPKSNTLQNSEQITDFLLSKSKLIKTEKIPAPFAIPTNGIAADPSHLYSAKTHGGIDIWSNLNGKGIDANSSKGYAVYSACSGKVIRVYYPNQEIEVECDMLGNDYLGVVPSLRVKVLYSHMGDAVTKQAYHKIKLGQRLIKGELIGYQGNQSSINPDNRITHLHFGVYDLTKSGRPTLDPETYIGVSATTLGQKFISKL